MVGYDRRAVGVFSTRQAADSALQELRNAGFHMDNVSVIARNEETAPGTTGTMGGATVTTDVGNKADEGAAKGAVTGGALGTLGGLLVGLGALAIPGVGPVMLAGATATALATTAAGGAIGAAAGGLVGALVGLGIPEERAAVYNERLGRGHYIVVVDGTEAEIRQAEGVLSTRGVEEWGVYGTNLAPLPKAGPPIV